MCAFKVHEPLSSSHGVVVPSIEAKGVAVAGQCSVRVIVCCVLVATQGVGVPTIISTCIYVNFISGSRSVQCLGHCSLRARGRSGCRYTCRAV